MQRVAFVMRVREGQQQEYIRRHQQVWPEVQANMRQAGIHSMSIYMAGLQLFLYMEVEDYARAAAFLAADPASQRWEKHMAPIMENAAGDEYDPANAYPDGLPEVFHWQAD
jgi:L-rhamnose mutarotase